jgi:radical SAM protein with 4Fe4S-binding SPASM domain
VERVRKLKQANIKCVSMSTNASLLTEDKTRALFDAGLDELMFSIDTVDKETYEKTRIGLKFDTAVKNIKMFFRLRDELKPDTKIRVRGVFFEDPDKEEHKKHIGMWEDFWGRLKKPNDRIYLKRAHNWGNQKVWEDKLKKYDWVYHPCVLPWSTLHITTMGIVPLCPQDYDAKMNIGDINENTIAEVWRNENWTRIRELHSTGSRNEIRFCQGCRLFDLDFSLEKKEQIEEII